jgi:hypothetical protein
MNCDIPVYREAHKLSQGTPHEIWFPLWLLERYVNAAISQIYRVRETTRQISDYHGTWLLDQPNNSKIKLNIYSIFNGIV